MTITQALPSEPYCSLYGFDQAARTRRMALLELSPQDYKWGWQLQTEIIKPQLHAIIDGFYTMLLKQQEIHVFLQKGFEVAHLKKAQEDYLLSLGIQFNSAAYFEERLRIGVVHARVGVPLNLYQCAYRKLQQLLIDHIPHPIRAGQNGYQALLAFILKITTLDMSLAIETYHRSQVHVLETSLETLQDEATQLQHQTEIDELTGLANRKHILAILEKALLDSQRQHSALWVMMMDLDWFKKVNDTYGHLVGDKVLREVAARIQSALRDSDSVGRYGGEEFLVVLRNQPLATAQQIAERIREQITTRPIHTSNLEIPMTISVGLTCARRQDDVSSLIARADLALYKAKNAGRNQVTLSPGQAKPQRADF